MVLMSVHNENVLMLRIKNAQILFVQQDIYVIWSNNHLKFLMTICFYVKFVMLRENIKRVLMSAINVNMLYMKNVPKLNLNVKCVIKETVKKVNLSAHNVNMLCVKNNLLMMTINNINKRRIINQDIYILTQKILIMIPKLVVTAVRKMQLPNQIKIK